MAEQELQRQIEQGRRIDTNRISESSSDLFEIDSVCFGRQHRLEHGDRQRSERVGGLRSEREIGGHRRNRSRGPRSVRRRVCCSGDVRARRRYGSPVPVRGEIRVPAAGGERRRCTSVQLRRRGTT
ncbi:hypothetical protein HPP92_017919 [Vanilla planifolia]|uniref:Uncharacterized protein n=1 Tax=Vanilla planifolia TaxID=51239 RepID=A0A835Q8U9_VANPL|nr:hypothetical protein HPP92_017919 [Vanilla planifolia]